MSDTQRTPEWYSSRCARVTASAISNVMMDKSKAGYRNYMAQLVCERLTGQATETYTSPAMQHGIDTEAEAISNAKEALALWFEPSPLKLRKSSKLMELAVP